ncbi:MAG TPA: hypothetical protein DHV42_06515, partial [Lachnospiraceae bacterium]|nr:hypothetical protein [Lachnospiraceae bacterium]
MRLLKKSGLTAFIVFAIAFALVPVFGMRAHAGKTVARVVHQRWGYRSTPYKSLQSALDAVKNDERILLLKDVTARNGEGYRVTGGKSFILDLCGHSITTSSESIACNALHIDNAGGELEPPRGSLRAKGKNACNMTISGGKFFGKVTNTGKTGFITGG